MNTEPSFNLTHYMHWTLRMALGSVFIFHGIEKIMDPIGVANMLELPLLLISALAFAETIGGVLVLAGGFGFDWATRAGSALLVPPMIGAITLIHWGQWRFTASPTHPMGGMEFQVVLLLLSLYFTVLGNGAVVTSKKVQSKRVTA